METACAFVDGMKYSDYANDLKTNMAVERAITIIGEASRNIPDEIRKQFPMIPWADMVGMRNFVSHVYFRVNQETVWKTVTVVILNYYLPSLVALMNWSRSNPHMQPFSQLTGVVAPMDRVDVDTDQIIPAQFLKRIEKTGFGQFLFYKWRFDEDGSPDPEFELNLPGYEDASILVTGRNFGSGSSREHAPWALLDYGIRCVIAPSFADIFSNNSLQNGILLITFPDSTVRQVMQKAKTNPGYRLHVDLENQRVWDDDEEVNESFDIDEFAKYKLLNGLDDIGLTLQHEDKIAAYEVVRGL